MQRLFGLRCLILLSFFAAAPAGAATTLKGFSNYFPTVEQPDATTIVVYAGATSTACSSTSSDSTCDSCATLSSAPINNFNATFADGLACNNTQIHPNLNFQIRLVSTDAAMYTASTKIQIFNGTTPIPPDSMTTFTAGTANQEVTATWSWSKLCAALSSDSAPNLASKCEISFNKTLTVGFDKTGAGTAPSETGITLTIKYRFVGNSPPQTFGCDESAMGAYEAFCEFFVYPGDEKVYVKNPGINAASDLKTGDQILKQNSTQATTADPSGMSYSKVRIYYAAGSDFNSLTPASDHTDLELVGTTEIRDKRVQGLVNGQQYVFLSASVDQGGNVELFSDPTFSPAMSSADGLGDTQSATPQEVFGLLDNKNCFIATAAYGSGDASDVQTLREFRNRYLLGWEGGRAFVRMYYKISPPIADFISEREWMKLMVRDSLKPLVMLAQFLFRYGLLILLFFIAGAGIFFFVGVRFLLKGPSK
jgi:hypothetical protein